MTRIKWLSAEWPVSLRTIASRMRSRPFTPDNMDGFFVERVRDNKIEGRFVEKFAFAEKVTDPFGNEHVFERINYSQVSFQLNTEFPQIELRDAPRGLGVYLTRLSELTDFSVSISPISVDLLGWIEAIQAQTRAKAVVDSLDVSDLIADAGVTARVVIKGDRDVRQALHGLARNRKYSLEKLHLKLFDSTGITLLQLSSAGSVKLQDGSVERVLDIVRQAMPTQPRE